MPDVLRSNVRMDCGGVDLVNPVDRMPPGSFPYLINARVVEEGSIDGRPGYTMFAPVALTTKLLNSIRRLNANGTYSYIVGDGTQLWAGLESALAPIDTGYSGNPLSLITFRPDQSPDSWMYVYDQNKLVKVNTAGTLRPVGVAPPVRAPSIEYGRPQMSGVVDGTSVAGYGFSGATTGVSLADRTNGAGLTIGTIIYNTGTTGWCCISPSAGDATWAGERMRVILNGTEFPQVREIHAPITATTIQSIQYDAGTSGLCSMVLTNSPANLARNSLIVLAAAETVRVLEVILNPDGTSYSVRCVTAGTRAATNTVTGLLSWYTYTTINHAAGEAITSPYILATQPAAGIGATAAKVSENAGTTIGGLRPISLADDYMHVSVFLQTPSNVASLFLLIDIDPATPAGTAFTNNFIEWSIPLPELGNFGTTSAGVWVELVVPLSQGVRMGNDLTLNLTTVQAVGVSLSSTGACDYGFDWWYNFGTYGPVIQPNAPTGVFYEVAYHDSTTGAASVPGPANRYQLFPLREDIIVTPPATTQTGVDSIDIYRIGGNLSTFTYTATVANNSGSPNSFDDGISDTSLEANPQADVTLLQPWPILGTAISGVVNVSGTTVKWVSGAQFPLALLSATIILINGHPFQTYGQPRSATYLELTQSAGSATNATYLIASPTLAGQPLPFAFGPLEGPLAPVVFALGDPINAGLLYYTNTSNADGASDLNTIELCAPSEPLISGAVWNGLAICGSRDNIYRVQYAYLQNVQYQFTRVPSASGIWSRWACCRGPDGVYFVGRDGIYLCNESQAINITDERLYPLFPHDGQAADPAGVNGIFPVNMALVDKLRLSCADRDIYFDYIDILGNPFTFRYEIAKKRWLPHFYGNSGNGGIVTHYLVELPAGAPNAMQLLLLGRTDGNIFLSGGNTDNGTAVTTIFQTPSNDGGDERAQKLYVDSMTDAGGTGTIALALEFNNNEIAGAVDTLTVTGSRAQLLTNIGSQTDLRLYRNISARYSFTGGPAGPRVYAYEPSGYIQPYVSTSLVTQFSDLDYMGWKHHRRLYPGIISTAAVLFTIWMDDGRKFGPYTIPSTGGRYRIQPQMLDVIKGLAESVQVTSTAPFAFFSDSFMIETKEWVEPDYLRLAIFKV